MAEPTACQHRNRKLARTRWANGDTVLWMRCDDCHANLNGGGKWYPKSELAYIDEDDIPIVDDRILERPPCVVCGTRGTELHHWAPREVFKSEADLWPTAYLCRPCHGRWHLEILRLKHNLTARPERRQEAG